MQLYHQGNGMRSEITYSGNNEITVTRKMVRE